MSRLSITAAALLLAAGCGEPGRPAVRLLVDSDASVPGALDGLHVTISASSPDGRVCEAVTGLVALGSRGDLTAPIVVEQGQVYTTAVLYEVVGWLGTAAVTAPVVGWTTWPSEGEQEVRVPLDPCFELDCDEGQACVDGGCAPVDLPPVFEDPSAVDRGITCGLGD